MIYRIVHNCEPSHHCEREDESSDYQLVQMIFHIEHICAPFLSRCLFRWASRPNDLLHWAHLCSFSPVWVIRCLFRWADKPKDLSHWAHLCNFAPLWVRRCQITCWTKRFVALSTFSQLRSRMRQQMPAQIAGIWKWLEAHCTSFVVGHLDSC